MVVKSLPVVKVGEFILPALESPTAFELLQS